MISTRQVAAVVEASLRSHPDMDLVVADNLQDRPYHLSGATIYLNGELPVTDAWEALAGALGELAARATTPPDPEPCCTVIPFQRRPGRAG